MTLSRSSSSTARKAGPSALYYPFLSPDTSWLKHALLYWDTVRRIVPVGQLSGLDPKEVREAVEANALVDTAPADYLEAAEQRFVERAFPLVSRDLSAIRSEAVEIFGLSVPTEVAISVHARKMTHRLQDKLVELGLVRPHEEWLLTPERVAALYMVCLASIMSERINTPLVTDTPEFAGGGEYMLMGKPPVKSRAGAPRAFLGRIGIDFPTPEQAGQLTMGKLLAFRKKRSGERARFRQAVEMIGKTLETVTDRNQLEDGLAQVRQEVSAALVDHKKALDELRVGSIQAAMTVSVPTVAAPASLAAMGVVNPVAAAALAGTGVAVNIVAWWAKHRGSARKHRTECPWHYLLSLQHVVGQDSSAKSGARSGSRWKRGGRRVFGKKRS